MEELASRLSEFLAPDMTAESVFEAARTGNVPKLRDLLGKRVPAPTDFRDKDRCTALHWAVENGHLDCVKLLLNKGAWQHAKDKDGLTPLHLAGAKGRLECLRALLERNGAVTHSMETDCWLEKMLLDVVLSDKIDVDVVDDLGRSPLHVAAANKHPECVLELLKNGADRDAKCEDGRSALHYAATQGCLDTLTVLLDGCADKDARDSDGLTPLHMAAKHGKLGCAKALLARGANYLLKSNDGLYPRDLAVDVGILDLLHSPLVYIEAETEKRLAAAVADYKNRVGTLGEQLEAQRRRVAELAAELGTARGRVAALELQQAASSQRLEDETRRRNSAELACRSLQAEVERLRATLAADATTAGGTTGGTTDINTGGTTVGTTGGPTANADAPIAVAADTDTTDDDCEWVAVQTPSAAPSASPAASGVKASVNGSSLPSSNLHGGNGQRKSITDDTDRHTLWERVERKAGGMLQKELAKAA